MVSAIISRVVILVFGTLYPAYASYKAVRTKNVKEYVKWMMYWIVFALFCSIETFSDVFLSWLPFYYELKIVFVVWMLSPLTQGSSFIFKKFVHPQLARREKEIDEMIAQASKQGYSTLLTLGSKGVNYASQMVMRTAIMGQSKLVDHLRRSYSTSDLTDDGQSVMQRHEAVGGGDEGDDELDNRLIEDNAELQMRTTSSKTKLIRSKSNASSYSLSSVKEEDNEGDEEEKVITETFTIPISSRKPLTAKEDFLLRAQRLARCQSLPPPITTDNKPSFPLSTTVQNTLESKRQFFASDRTNAKSCDEEECDSKANVRKNVKPYVPGTVSPSVQAKRDLFTRAHSQDNIIIRRTKPQVLAGINTQARKRLLLQRAQSEEPRARDTPEREPRQMSFTQHIAVSKKNKESQVLGSEENIDSVSSTNYGNERCSAEKGEKSPVLDVSKRRVKDNKELYMQGRKPVEKLRALKNEFIVLSDNEDWMSIEDDDSDIDQDSLIFCDMDTALDDNDFLSDDSPILEYKSFGSSSPDMDWNRKDSSDVIIIDSPKLIRLHKKVLPKEVDQGDANIDIERGVSQEPEKSTYKLKTGIDNYQSATSVDQSEGGSRYKTSPNTRPFQFKGSMFPKLDECHSQSAPTSPATSRMKHSGKAYYTLDPSLGSWRMELRSRRLYASTPETRPDLFRTAQSTGTSPLAQEARNLSDTANESQASPERGYSRSVSLESNETDPKQNVLASPSPDVVRPRAKSLSFEREFVPGGYVRRMSQDLRSSPFAQNKKA